MGTLPRDGEGEGGGGGGEGGGGGHPTQRPGARLGLLVFQAGTASLALW